MGGTREIARALAAATGHLRRHPEAGRVADRTGPDRDRGRHRGAALPRRRPLGNLVGTDMPPGLGGEDTGPTPGTVLRMAVGSCAATSLVMRAAQDGIELERVEVTVSSESDHRGLLGLDGVSPGPFGLRVRYRLSAPGVPAERLRALVDWAERHSPVAAAARRPLPVSVELETG